MAFGYREPTAEELLEEQALIIPNTELLPDQRSFLNAYFRTKGVVSAAKASKIHRFYHWQWMKEDKQYQAAFEALRAIVEAEDAEGIKKRAARGWLEPLTWKGTKTGESVRKYSDSLQLAYMRAVDPRWREGGQQPSGPAQIEITIVNSNQSAIVQNEKNSSKSE